MTGVSPILEVRGLHHQVDGHPILKGIDFQLAPGEFRLIIGPNGAGKSTLLKCILAIKRHQGQILFEGEPIAAASARWIARRIAYVPQFLELQFNLDVQSFMELSRFAHEKSPHQNTAELLDDCLKRTGTFHLKHAYLDQLSGGERQRVMIAAALAQQPRLLILDEPCHSLDPAHRVGLVALLDQLHRQTGLTILLVTHDWNEFVTLQPKILALKDGKTAFECASQALPGKLETLFQCAFLHLNDGNLTYSLAHDEEKAETRQH